MTAASKSNPKTMLSARVPAELAKLVRTIAARNQPPQSLSEFIKESVTNEVSRRSLTRPLKALTLRDLSAQLDQIQLQLAKQDDTSRINVALIQSVARQVGVQTE